MLRFNSLLFDAVICSDDQCKDNCYTWTALNGECASGAIIDGAKITLYSDSNCSTIIPGSDNIPILVGAACNVLLSNLYNLHIGSYKVSQHVPSAFALAAAAAAAVLLCCFLFYARIYWAKLAAAATGPIGPTAATAATRPIGATAAATPLLHESEDPE